MDSTELKRRIPSNISAGIHLVQPVGILLDEIHKMESHASCPSVGFQLVGSQAGFRLVPQGGLCRQSTCVHNPLDGIPHVGFPHTRRPSSHYPEKGFTAFMEYNAVCNAM
jgi:hypothetical protein